MGRFSASHLVFVNVTRAIKIVQLHDELVDELKSAIATELEAIGHPMLDHHRVDTRDVEHSLIDLVETLPRNGLGGINLHVTVRVYDVDNHRTEGYHALSVARLVEHLERQ